MGKLKAPLLSLSASGTFAKTITFAKWKGIPYARQHAVPTNPKTAAQMAQRGLMGLAVTAWHSLQSPVPQGWNDQAPYAPKPMSGFNAFTKAAIAQGRAADTAPIVDELEVSTGPDEFACNIHAAQINGLADAEGESLVVHWGTAPTRLTSTTVMTDNSLGNYGATLSSGSGTYYVRVYDATTGTYISGLHSVTVT